MNMLESFLTALDSLVSNKLRSILTMLGVIIGVAAVIALMSLGNGFSKFLESEINSIGTNLIFVTTDTDNTNGRLSLSIDDVIALEDKSRAPDIDKVGAIVQLNREVTGNGFGSRGSINGVTANYSEINNVGTLQYGDFISISDELNRSRVAVIGFDLAEDIFGKDPFPIGETVKIDGAAYEVIGMFEYQEGSFGENPGTNVYIPISTAQQRLWTRRTKDGKAAVSAITVQGQPEKTQEALDQIATIMREEHGVTYADEDDFITGSQEDLLETFGQLTAGLTLFLGFIASISLIVGGIGIMNIMLVSVTERTREIGIRKALGALKRDILTQFLIESMFLSLIGGLIGVLLGWGITLLTNRFNTTFSAVIDTQAVILAVTVSLIVGLVFGVYPAWRAASLRPIEALRYE